MYYLVRHGQTAKNKERLLQGRTDVPLNDTGRQQARQLSDYFAKKGITFDLVFSSPLGRAVETAGLIVPGAEILIDDRLTEMDYGPYEGAGLTNLPPEILHFFSDFIHNPAPDGMEPLASVTARVGEFLESIHGHGEKNVLISLHAISMKGALEYLTPDSSGAYWARNIPNCGLYCFAEADGRYGRPVEVRY